MPASRVLCCAMMLTACASAGVDSGGADARPMTTDGPAPRIDAPVAIDAPSSSTCTSAATCAGAMMLGSVSGDTGNVKLSTMGFQSAWVRVRVTEDDSAIFGLTLRVGAKLTSPAAADFDVFVYVNTGSNVVECSTTVGTTTTTGNVNETRAEWGEGAIANGADDGRDVSIEVRSISGSCSPGQMWQLEVEGNWN